MNFFLYVSKSERKNLAPKELNESSIASDRENSTSEFTKSAV